MVQRVTLRTRKSYSTKSNGRRIIKTPGRADEGHSSSSRERMAALTPSSSRGTGGKLRYIQVKKTAAAPKCGDCHIALPGVRPLPSLPPRISGSPVPALRPREYAQISKRQKTVQRAYGGSRCATCVRDRIVRAFLVEEAKIVKRVIAQQTKGKK
ncbi:SPOSA6832_04824, partial [Sporobolomyces salmonicolor]